VCFLCIYTIQFGQHDELRQQLLDTGDARIMFVSDDSFLGSRCDDDASRTWHGKNFLGKSLMKLKEKFQVLVY